jgi:hypothetical protein
VENTNRLNLKDMFHEYVFTEKAVTGYSTKSERDRERQRERERERVTNRGKGKKSMKEVK